MAVVDAAYRAGAGPKRLVALKRLAARFSADDRARRLFLREASILTQIEHRNVVRTYEVGEVDGEAFIAMELLEGATLAQLLSATPGRVPLPVALRIARDALRGLHEAHELRTPEGGPLGLVHQDVSPQNIHVAYEGTTRILDFGVARLAATDASRTGSVLGKSCYLSPEQLAFGSVDRRADIFALGVVLYELLTSEELFPRGSADAAYAAILQGGVHSPRSVCPDVPVEIDAVVRRALARAPSERFASADAMRAALVEAQEDAAIRDVDVDVVGEWVSAAVPRAWTRAELERELREDSVRAAPADPRARWFGDASRTEAGDIHVLPTLGKPRARPRRLWLGLATAAVVGAIAGRAVLVRDRAQPASDPLPLLSTRADRAPDRGAPNPAAPNPALPPADPPARGTAATRQGSALPLVTRGEEVATTHSSPTRSLPPPTRHAPEPHTAKSAVVAPSPPTSAQPGSTDDLYEHM